MIESDFFFLCMVLYQHALYHCPVKKCAKDFKILGGLISHLESEACLWCYTVRQGRGWCGEAHSTRRSLVEASVLFVLDGLIFRGVFFMLRSDQRDKNDLEK